MPLLPEIFAGRIQRAPDGTLTSRLLPPEVRAASAQAVAESRAQAQAVERHQKRQARQKARTIRRGATAAERYQRGEIDRETALEDAIFAELAATPDVIPMPKPPKPKRGSRRKRKA